MYKAEPRLVTRFGAAGSVEPRWRGRKPGETDDIGGKSGGFDFSRPDRFLRPKHDNYPVDVKHYTTMNELIQNANVTTQQLPGLSAQVSGYTGFKPRYPTTKQGTSDWTSV